ncbi:MAG: nucleotide sugar dehydrogenase [candidate division Zixibacteria bacterium]|nr:nucleotide sugar dehydrogenase [candidate division Zixibacteria bacterium]
MKADDSILVVGAGFVGLATAAFLATKDHQVTVVEKNPLIIESLNNGRLHFREPALAVKLKSAVTKNRLTVVPPSKERYQNTSMVIVAIDSADRKTWKMKLAAFERMAEWIGSEKRRQPAIVVLKSTNILGFSRLFRALLDKAPHGRSVQLVVNPEFLREGTAYEDTARPWRVVVGADEPKARQRMVRFYRQMYPKSMPIVTTDCESAELIKLGANLYLSHRLAFIHEMAEYANDRGLDIDAIQQGISLDPRVGGEYFEPGLVFGGSCLPKDCYLINSREAGNTFNFLTADTALEINERVLSHLVATLQNRIGKLKGKKIAILGAAFKPECDDTRGSQAVKLALMLRRRGAAVSIFDPYLKHAERIVEGNLPLSPDVDQTLSGAHALIIGTAHKKFAGLRPSKAAELVKRQCVADRFRLLNRSNWESKGFEFV